MKVLLVVLVLNFLVYMCFWVKLTQLEEWLIRISRDIVKIEPNIMFDKEEK